MRTYSPADIGEKTIETYPFQDEWKALFGEPDIRFSTLIRGKAKSGKSTYCMKKAQYLSQFGRVLYVSAEERINSKTLQQRLITCGVKSKNVRIVHTKHIEDIEQLLKTGGYRFCIIDSVQHVKMTYEDWENLRQKFKRRKLSWHLVMQMGITITKWEHEVDVLVEIKNGYAYAQGRYGKADRMQVLQHQQAQGSLF